MSQTVVCVSIKTCGDMMYRIFIADTRDTRFDTSGTVRGMIDAYASGSALVVTR